MLCDLADQRWPAPSCLSRRPTSHAKSLTGTGQRFIGLSCSHSLFILCLQLLVNVLRDYKQRNIGLVLANPSEKVMSMLERTTLPDEIGNPGLCAEGTASCRCCM